ncbi:hypothetical protein Marpi_1649 [Marinitoga piezophila KA3]|uniref:Uncharacterized protein n=1 Tax=Marinitoga piezophila (strain DSM 14283 / JCM 11233 / KA3) TaxID=443254 RepID=H2J521_MARPK|nr:MULTISPECIES: hypothetical protein [Marinitoga]AEX86038.1 hypothetical protein Marpi_1649 [Marinitoga piezophila KA3]NUU98145.1 hypothetical protein [Marinitoga sp. 1138]
MKPKWLLIIIFLLSLIVFGGSSGFYLGMSYIPVSEIKSPDNSIDLHDGVLYPLYGFRMNVDKFYFGIEGTMNMENNTNSLQISYEGGKVGYIFNIFNKIGVDLGILGGHYTQSFLKVVDGGKTLEDFKNNTAIHYIKLSKDYYILSPSMGMHIYFTKHFGLFLKGAYNFGYSQSGWYFEDDPSLYIVRDSSETNNFLKWYDISVFLEIGSLY